MNDDKHKIKSFKYVYPQIYSYILPKEKENEGSQKIGYTERKDVEARIEEQTHTAAKRLEYRILWNSPAFFSDKKTDFKDKDFHRFLIEKGVEQRKNLGSEWFYFNGYPEKSKELFDEFKKSREVVSKESIQKLQYQLRGEQEEAIKQALEYFKSHEKGEFLWNAKPRFGKTLASYDLAKKLGAKKVLIVTNRPAIANSWFDDYEKFIDGYSFISETKSLKGRSVISRKEYHQNYIDKKIDRPFIAFLSLQDLKGSEYFGGPYNKLEWVAGLTWDLLIIDEAHEGVDTSKTNMAFDNVKRKNTLHLSGTPFKAIANEKFSEEAIYNWTYLDEQKVKKEELQEGESGGHVDLPDLKLFTYRISEMIRGEINKGVDIDGETKDYTFNLNEFFSTTESGSFVYEKDVERFLDNLTANKKYPFSTPELRDELCHTFWYVGNRITSVKALESLLKKNNVFKDYKVIVAAGDGKTFEEEENDYEGNEKSFDKVINAIKKYPKTITLSCGQLTTGVTIKEWSAVLMLSDLKSPATYMQAAFRAQNPYRFFEDGKLKTKESAYLFDFAPTRVLEIYDDFANSLNPKVISGEIGEEEKKENIKELLNYFPVISEDSEGEMIELDAEKVLTFPMLISANEVVRLRFMSNLLFDSEVIGNVFSYPKQIEAIINKFSPVKNKKVTSTTKRINLDELGDAEKEKTIRINDNKNVILGEKIYRSKELDKIFEDFEKKEKTENELSEEIFSVAEPVIAKYKEVYDSKEKEIKQIEKKTKEKIRVMVDEYLGNEIKDSKALKENIGNFIQNELIGKAIEEKEEKAVENKAKEAEKDIRDRLRAFTRTIPMFVMASPHRDEITIDNYDQWVSDEDFEDLTNITKEEFHMLRDGGIFEDENGKEIEFKGAFNKSIFNQSIKEFIKEVKKKSDYFKVDKDIFELIPNQKNNQIFTPKNVVEMMIDSLEKESPELFKRTDSTFIDLYMKSGMYITEIVKRLFKNTRSKYATDEDCIKHILENQVYGLTPTKILHDITSNYIFGFNENIKVSRKNFIQYDLIEDAKSGSVREKLSELYNKDMIKFDAVVGNPPYQKETKDTSDTAIYPFFYDLAEQIAPQYCLISPARFLFNAGKTSNVWNKKMLNNEHLKVLFYEQKSERLFLNTDIKGGIAILYYDKAVKFGKIGTFTAFEELNSIANKVENRDTFSSIIPIIYLQQKFNLDKLFKEHPNIKEKIGSEGKERRLTTSIFTNDEIFTDKKETENSVKILGLIKNKRNFKYIKESYLEQHINLKKYKVILPAANGAGAIGEVLSTPLVGEPLVGEPLVGFTQSFISFGAFENELEAQNCMKYIKSKFARTMLGVLKITQHNTPEKWEKVPLQDFTQNSDINWSVSIPEIDQQLYEKYKLTKQEIDFIESKVKSMD